jgi:polar amino acid transport system permease protein
MQGFWAPRRIVMAAIAAGIVVWCVLALNWTWLADPKYQGLILQGIWTTIWLLVVTMVLGMLLAIPLGLAQAAGPWWLALPAAGFCGLIRGTPLLLQLWLLYYGLGSLFQSYPWIRETWYWPILRQDWPYAVLALSLSVAGYEGEVMRGAFKGVPHGQLEAAKAMGMPRFHHLPPDLAAAGAASRVADPGRRDGVADEGDAIGRDDHGHRHLCGVVAHPAGHVRRL